MSLLINVALIAAGFWLWPPLGWMLCGRLAHLFCQAAYLALHDYSEADLTPRGKVRLR